MVRDEGDLARQMREVARLVLGPPNMALSSEWKWCYGRKGSLAIDLRQGVWFDHEAGTGGGVLDLVRVTQNLSSNRVAADWLRARGILPDDRRAGADKAHRMPAIQRRPTASNAAASGAAGAEPAVYWNLDDAPEKTRRACAIWRDSTPLSHPDAALGVAYLTSRGLSPPYPETLAFAEQRHPDTGEVLPTLIVARHCPVVGMVRGIQQIFIDPAGGKYRGDMAKWSLGSIAGGRAELLGEFRPERLLVGEGVETALSAARLFRYGSAWAMCGAFPRDIALPPSVRHVLLVADNDKSGTSVKKALALAQWIIRTGRECTIEIPNSLGADANDVLKAVALDTHGQLSGAAGCRPAASEPGSR